MKSSKEELYFSTYPTLVVQAARFGDLVQTGRLVRSLCLHGETHLCVDASLSELAAMLYPEAVIHALHFHLPPSTDKMSVNLDNLSKLVKIPFKRIYNCNYSYLSEAVCRMFPTKHVIGYRASGHADGGIWRSEWLRLIFRFTQKRNMASINLVDAWGFFSENPFAPYLVNPVAKGGGKGLGLVLSGREARRSLPAETLATIATICFKFLEPAEVRLFGLAADQPLARKFLRVIPPAMQVRIRDLTGKTGWKELKEELRGLDLLLCPDTGTMHLACHLGVPVMAFFLSSAWCHETGPYGSGHFIWQASPDCAPCMESAPCRNGLKCLEAFTSPGFARCLAQALEKGIADCPSGMQLWKTSFDKLGQTLMLKGGMDKYQESRMAARSLVSSWLGLSPPSVLETYSPELLSNLVSDFFPAAEWMLPPRRYC